MEKTVQAADLESRIANYKGRAASLSHKQLGELEEQIWTLARKVHGSSLRGDERSRWLVEHLGGTTTHYERRYQLRNSPWASELWTLLDSDVLSIDKSARLIAEARRVGRSDTVRKRRLQEILRTYIGTQSEDEPQPAKRAGDLMSASRQFRRVLKAQIDILLSTISARDSFETRALTKEFVSSLDVAVEELIRGVRKIRANGDTDEILDRTIVSKIEHEDACIVLTLKAKWGEHADLDAARRGRMRVQRETHPDANQGSSEHLGLFHQAGQAYEILVRYNKQLEEGLITRRKKGSRS